MEGDDENREFKDFCTDIVTNHIMVSNYIIYYILLIHFIQIVLSYI